MSMTRLLSTVTVLVLVSAILIGTLSWNYGVFNSGPGKSVNKLLINCLMNERISPELGHSK